MKNLLTFLSIVLLAASCATPPPPVVEKDYTYYGEKFDPKGPSTLVQAIAEFQKGGLKPVVGIGDSEEVGLVTKVESQVESVCQEKGCWMNLQDSLGNEVFVRFKDYGFFMPKDLVGKKVVAYGNFYQDTTSVEELQHYAEDEGLSEEEIAKITAPKVEFKFYASGVAVEN